MSAITVEGVAYTAATLDLGSVLLCLVGDDVSVLGFAMQFQHIHIVGGYG